MVRESIQLGAEPVCGFTIEQMVRRLVDLVTQRQQNADQTIGRR